MYLILQRYKQELRLSRLQRSKGEFIIEHPSTKKQSLSCVTHKLMTLSGKINIMNNMILRLQSTICLF